MNNLQLQEQRFESIKSLCNNYKKDSLSRKTMQYLNIRLTSLEEQWKDFDSRHAVIEQEIGDKDITYFTDDIYGKTKSLYETTKDEMKKLLRKLQEDYKSVKFDLSDLFDEQTNDKLENLVVKQQSNFKAIDRVMSKTHVDILTEKWELEEQLSILKSKWDAIDKLHWELEPYLKGSNEKYNEMFLDIEDRYDDLRKQLSNKIWTSVHYEKTVPKVDIPEFSGSYTHWVSFKDLYCETVHNNPMINQAQKMQLLKTKLRGEAERLVKHLTISADNYESCWDILVQRYDNRRLQFTSLLNIMIDLPAIQEADAFNLKRMHDVIQEVINGLTNMGIDTNASGSILAHLMSLKLDSKCFDEYVKEVQDPREVPTISELLYFLESKFMAYEVRKGAKKESYNEKKPSANYQLKQFNKQVHAKKPNFDAKKPFSKTYHTVHSHYGQCPCCDENHVLMQCPKFLLMNTWQRNNTVSKLQVCKNCLFSHGNAKCTSSKTCKECDQNHHTLLHNNIKNKTPLSNNGNGNEKQSTSSNGNHQSSNHLANDEMEVLLTTVQLNIKTIDGTYIKLRALLDRGSQVNLITENAAQMLRLPRKRINATISGVGSVSGDCKGRLQLTCKSIYSDYSFETEALILKKLTNNLPNSTFEKQNWPHLESLKLADPDYNVSRSIDLLLGADVYSDIIMQGVLKGEQQSPIAQQTHLGWILCGKLKTFNCHVTLVDLNKITKFWENEDITPQSNDDVSNEDQCEKFYTKTVKRGSDGKYTVKMPFCPDAEKKLGKSKSIAISQFLQLENKLQRKNKLAAMYREFINEYIELGHMKPASPISNSELECYLPHHGVLREHSTTTKLRVVFNASQKTSSGHSLNSLQQKGPNLQKDIQALILKWRSYKYAFTADIEKMYRCIWISDDQQPLQKIIWRNSPNEKIQELQLCTVTYGTKSAPWLALRTLKQLAIDDGHKYPAAAHVLLNEFFVDDLVSGHHSIDEALELQRSLISLLSGAGMNLRKWSGNHPALLQNLSEDQISTKSRLLSREFYIDFNYV